MLGRCPGLYCGRIQNESTGLWSDCGSCPRGFRVNENYTCTSCTLPPTYYDWLFLGFMSLMPLIMHWFFIDLSAKQRTFSLGQIVLHVSALFEVTVSAFICLFISDPIFKLTLNSCGVKRLSDWYTLFHNPTPNYEEKLYCTQEAVYPLQTIVLLFYLLSLVLMMIIRPPLNRRFLKEGKNAVYCALYFFPILTLIHAVAGGLIYYAFPYLSIVISMISNACHYSLKMDQSMKSLTKTSIMEPKNAVIIVGHWLLLAYGIISLHQHLALLALVPLPSLFYIITGKFTDPTEWDQTN